MSMSKQLRTYPHSPPPNSTWTPTYYQLTVVGLEGGGVGAQLPVTDIEQNVL